jgi:two-component system chemotaxis response regulator CheB
MPGAIINVMIVDDSVVARRVLSRILDADGRFAVVGSFSDAAQALAALSRQQTDMILLDIEMPGQNGTDSLPDLLEASHNALIVMLSGHHAENGAVAMEAIARGARDIITKPVAGHFSDAFACALTERLSAIHIGQDKSCWKGEEAKATALQGLTCPPRAIGIGASTGGIHALTAFLGALGGPPRVPIFITQHLPADFLPFFAEQLARETQFPVRLAEDGMPVAGGHIYVAPGQAHLTVVRTAQRYIQIRHSYAKCRHAAYPAVDPMFMSLAEVYGAGACAIVLSGMGRDGLAGAEAIVRAGGSVIAQDSASSVVWGMPGVVVQAGLACLTLPPEEAARTLAESWKIAA